MTRMLSELLGAQEPEFRLHIRALERASGDPNADIRLSSDILKRVQTKLLELNLSPSDTTGLELYNALQQRLLSDEKRLRQYLNLSDKVTNEEVLQSVQRLVSKLSIPRRSFSLKLSVAKRLLQINPPKKSMKTLGYRSLTSMLKHEPIPQLYVAALLRESTHWHKSLKKQYRELRPSDFESRPITIYRPTNKHWSELATEFASNYKHICVDFKELGAIVMLPVETTIPAIATISTLLLLEGINDIRCSSAFLKLQQVKPEFGHLVSQIAYDESNNSVSIAGRTLPWRLIQRYYSSVREVYYPTLFEPHVQLEDLQLAKAEKSLAKIIPALAFWLDTANLALVYNGQPVSLNMLDVALNVANTMPFNKRVLQNVRANVWYDLLANYFHPSNLDQVANGQLSEELVEPDLAVAETVKEDRHESSE